MEDLDGLPEQANRVASSATPTALADALRKLVVTSTVFQDEIEDARPTFDPQVFMDWDDAIDAASSLLAEGSHTSSFRNVTEAELEVMAAAHDPLTWGNAKDNPAFRARRLNAMRAAIEALRK